MESEVAYFATVRQDGGPRVHPVTPFASEKHLFLFMEKTSPKYDDLLREPRYQLHCSVEDDDGGNGEFYIRGEARLVEDPAMRTEAEAACRYTPKDHYILFELEVDFAFGLIYSDDGDMQKMRWQAEQV